MFDKVLIANRGEIAVRIIKACREMGLKTVAVYAETEQDARHVFMADEAICLGGAAPADSYLRGDKIIMAAQQTGAQAIHPGYGFLSENADFVEQVTAAGLIFIGPGAEAIRVMGRKTTARTRMIAAGVPVVPGYQGDNTADFTTVATELGYPVLVKASAGGGGKGMRVVHAPQDLNAAIQAARREAKNAFGDGQVYLEKYIAQPRHIEFQILADRHGNTRHLFERECSIQRRHQKIIEETPSPALDEALRAQMAAAAVAAAKAVGYVNAGTIEFLLDETGKFYFLEMNTRLQVEHPITEMVTGLDLVQWQLRIAGGEVISFSQTALQQSGHAIECRIYAEDPANNFLPAIGDILWMEEPHGPGIRVDSGLNRRDRVTVYYDPMLAKLIVHAADRHLAIQKMQAALRDYTILGLTTNIPFLQTVLHTPAFVEGETHTHFIETHLPDWQTPELAPPEAVLIAAAMFEQLAGRPVNGSSVGTSAGDEPHNPWHRADNFRLGHGG